MPKAWTVQDSNGEMLPHFAAIDPAVAYGRHPLQPHQLIDRVTSIDDTIILCHLGIPRLGATEWALSIDGLVRRPTRLTLDDFARGRARMDTRNRPPERAMRFISF